MSQNFKINSGPFFKGALANILLQFFAYFLTQFLGGPMIFATDQTSHKIALGLVSLGLGLIVINAVLAFYPKASHRSDTPELKLDFSWPRLSFFLSILVFNLALGFYLKSWLMVLAAFLAYGFWRGGQAEFSFKFLAGRLRQKNKFVFYGISGVLAFIFIFILLNFATFWHRSVVWEKRNVKISYDQASSVKVPLQFKSPGASYSAISQNFPAPLLQNESTSFGNQDYLLIAKIDVKAPLVFVSGTSQKELNQALNRGVVVYPGSALPGQNGEVFLTGHSSTYIWNATRFGQVFSLLDKLEIGDIVSIFYQSQQYDYRITGKEILAPALTKVSNTNQSTLALMTCWPPGTTFERLVARGELIK